MISEKALLEQARRLADGIMKNTATPGTAHYIRELRCMGSIGITAVRTAGRHCTIFCNGLMTILPKGCHRRM